MSKEKQSRFIGNKRIRKAKPPVVTYEAIVTITDDGSDGAGGIGYLTRKEIKDLLTEGARKWAGVRVHVNALQELPGRQEV